VFKITNPFLFYVVPSIFFMIGCNNADNNYYSINKVRVVAAVFQNNALLSGNSISGTSSQQFPLRLTSSTVSCATTHFYLVTVSPTNETPTITLNSIVLFALGNNYLSGGGGSRGVQAGTSGPNIAASNFFSSVNPTITSIQITPYRVTVFDYPVNCSNLTTTNLNSYMGQIGDIPGFQLSYSANTGVSNDQGFYSFYFLPEPTDSWWSTTSFPSSVPSAKMTQVQNGLAVTNTPIQITGVLPNGSNIPGNSGTNIIANLSSQSIPSPRDPNNSIYNPELRLQWYVTSGNLDLDTSNSTSWNPGVGVGNNVGGFVVVRDLLGGVDFKVLGPFTTQ
jgi:hypothetical protein